MDKFISSILCVVVLSGLVSADSFTVGDSIRFLTRSIGSVILQFVASGDYLVVLFFLFFLFVFMVAFLASVVMFGLWVMKKVVF